MQLKCVCCESLNLVCLGIIPSSFDFAGRLLDRPLQGGSLFCCQSCGLMFRYPHLSKKELDTLYYQGNENAWKANVNSRKDWQIAKSWISMHLPTSKTILDAGCSDGEFLHSFVRSHELYGIEINPAKCEQARKKGIQLIGNDFATIDETKMQFDVVTSFDVIEHFHNPMDYLLKLVRLTRKDGIVIVSTGNSNAFSWRIMKAGYWYSAIGEHLSFINPNWCEWVAQVIGLELKKIEYFSHTNAKYGQQIGETVKNLLYMASPTAFAWFRKIGLGSDEMRKYKELLKYPPGWGSAKDHFISLFIKNE